MKEVTNFDNPSLRRMLEEIRVGHIDIEGIILEELNQFLPAFITDMVRGAYETRVAGAKA